MTANKQQEGKEQARERGKKERCKRLRTSSSLFKCTKWMGRVCVCVCERERERERETTQN